VQAHSGGIGDLAFSKKGGWLASSRAAAKYGAPALALTALEDSVSPVDRARLLMLADQPGVPLAWEQAEDAGEVSPAVLKLVLAEVQAEESSD